MVRYVNRFCAFNSLNLYELIGDMNKFLEAGQQTMRSVTFNFSTTYRREQIEYAVIILYQEVYDDAQETPA